MGISVQQSVPLSLDREKITRIIRFTIGLDLELENTRVRHRLWELFKRFPDEASARIYIEQAFWPNGPVCPRCKSWEHLGSGTDPYRCNACDRQFKVWTGTIFEGSHIQLHYWLWAIIIFAQARRKVSSNKLAKLLGISQPAAWAMIRRLRPVWAELWENLPELFDRTYLDFVDFPISKPWTFFSGRARLFTKWTKGDLVLEGDAYSLSPEDILLFGGNRSPEERATADAKWKSMEKSRKAEDWARRLKRKPKLRKWFNERLERRREKSIAHKQDHLNWLPFKWMPQRDCPMCRFGEREWRRWEAIAVQLDFVLWEEFWDWIEDLDRQLKDMGELARYEDEHGLVDPWKASQRWWDEEFITRWQSLNDRVKLRYERFYRYLNKLNIKRMEEWRGMQEQERDRKHLEGLADVVI